MGVAIAIRSFPGSICTPQLTQLSNDHWTTKKTGCGLGGDFSSYPLLKKMPKNKDLVLNHRFLRRFVFVPPRQHPKHPRVRPPQRFPRAPTSPRQCLNTTMIMTFFDRNPYTETCIYHLASWGVKIQGLLSYKKIVVQIAGIDLEKNAILDGILLRYFL